jgi:hypothetical protein
MELEILRTYYAGGTNGVVHVNSRFQCYSIELPWLDNQPRRSCIPEGRYLLQKRYSPKYKQHLLVADVKGRSFILIHPANDAQKELLGCIAPVTRLTGAGKGAESRKAFHDLISKVYQALDKGAVYVTIKKNMR